ncbi:MAG TPA: translation elongation factor Ts [Bacteroidales bacterium]|nr:translation elongation factor Ts [Bacteroidales bacterium]
MANISAADVNKLRQMTGAGMMDCKKALEETGGDFEKAIDHLRKKGQKIAAKRADRDANEGIVLARANEEKTYAGMIMVNCETDFVGKTDQFRQFAKDLLDLGVAHKPKTVEELKGLKLNNVTVADLLNDMLGKTGEKIQIAHYEFLEAPIVAAYNHHGNRLGTLLGLSKKSAEIAHELAMQVAAMNPIAVDTKDVPQEVIDREMEIGKEQARQEGKPEEMLEKIAAGKLNKFFKERTLLNQDFVRDTKKTVRQFLSEHDKEITVTGFKRLMLGE